MKAALPHNEQARLTALRRYQILDTPGEAEYDDLARLASDICGTPISLVSLVDADRQWFKSNVGLEGIRQTPRDEAFCAHNILEPDRLLVVEDARKDFRFADNPLVQGDPNIVFYAGAPLVTQDGATLGSLCVIDRQQRKLSERQRDALRILANQVVKLIELRSVLTQAQQQHQALRYAHANLQDFSHTIAHDLKAPLRNIRAFAEILGEDYAEALPTEGKEIVTLVVDLAAEAKGMVESVLRFSLALNQYTVDQEVVDVEVLVATVVRRLDVPQHGELRFVGPDRTVKLPRMPLDHILQNLIDNAIRYSDEACPAVSIGCTASETHYTFFVKDNGSGIPDHLRDSVFELFVTTDERDSKGHGVGLKIVQRMVELLNGEIELKTGEGKGTTFTIRLPR